MQQAAHNSCFHAIFATYPVINEIAACLNSLRQAIFGASVNRDRSAQDIVLQDHIF